MCPSRSIWHRIAASIATAAAALVLGAVAAPGQAGAVTTDSGVWASPTLTVRVTGTAWTGTDIPAALAQWAPAKVMTLTDSADADVTLSAAPATGELAGATAYRSTVDGVIQSCRVDLSEQLAGRDWTAVLTHELGHCLGIGHTDVGTAAPTVMWRAAYGPHFSAAVTATDLAAVRALSR